MDELIGGITEGSNYFEDFLLSPETGIEPG